MVAKITVLDKEIVLFCEEKGLQRFSVIPTKLGNL